MCPILVVWTFPDVPIRFSMDLWYMGRRFAQSFVDFIHARPRTRHALDQARHPMVLFHFPVRLVCCDSGSGKDAVAAVWCIFFFWGCLLLRSLLTLTIWMFTFRPRSCTTAMPQSHLDHPALDHPLPGPPICDMPVARLSSRHKPEV